MFYQVIHPIIKCIYISFFYIVKSNIADTDVLYFLPVIIIIYDINVKIHSFRLAVSSCLNYLLLCLSDEDDDEEDLDDSVVVLDEDDDEDGKFL